MYLSTPVFCTTLYPGQPLSDSQTDTPRTIMYVIEVSHPGQHIIWLAFAIWTLDTAYIALWDVFSGYLPLAIRISPVVRLINVLP
jgi:hypothetical protein